MNSKSTFREKATRGFLWNYLYKLTEIGLLNLYTILVVRHFGPEISAPYAVFMALGTMLTLISAFSVDGVLLRYVQRISGNDYTLEGDFSNVENLGLKKFFTTLFAFRILTVTVVSLIIFTLLFCLPILIPSLETSFGSIREFTPLLIAYLYAQAIIAFCTFSLIGLLETKRIFFSSLISRGLLLVVGLYLVFQASLSLWYAVGLYVGSSVINALLLLYVFTGEVTKHSGRKSSRRYPFSSILREMRHLLTGKGKMKFFLGTPIMLYGITTWGSDVLSTVLGKQPDILMMRALLGEYSSEIGYYLSASILLLMTEYIFLFGLGGTLVSIFSKLAHDDEKDQKGDDKSYPRLARARKEIAGFQNIVLLPLCAFMMFFAPEVIRSIYGDKYDAAIPLLRIGLIALALSVGIFAGGMQITSLVAIGKERVVFRNRLIWGVINIIANFFLIRTYGALGAIIGTQFTNAFACGTEAYLARSLIGNSISLFRKFLVMFLAGVSGAAGYYIVILLLPHVLPITKVCVGGLIVCGVTFLSYYFLHLEELESMKRLLRDQFTKKRISGAS